MTDEAWGGPLDHNGEPIIFRNYYRCGDCGHEWTDDYSCIPDDDCGKCGSRHWTPYKSTDLDEDGNEIPDEAKGPP